MFTRKKHKRIQTKKAFTLIEVLVSVSLFTVVAITGITAVIVGKTAYEKNRAIKNVTDSISFLVEDFSRTARLGKLYNCIQISGNPASVSLPEIEMIGPDSGGYCEGVAYEPFWDMETSDPLDQVVYVFVPTTTEPGEGGEDGVVGALYARGTFPALNEDGEQDEDAPLITVDSVNFQRVTPKSLDIDLQKSGFFVTDENTAFGTRPRITMYINGTISVKDQITDFSLQTTVSQRSLVIN